MESLHQSVIGWELPLGRGIALGEGSVPVWGVMNMTALKKEIWSEPCSIHSLHDLPQLPTHLASTSMAASWVPSPLSRGLLP